MSIASRLDDINEQLAGLILAVTELRRDISDPGESKQPKRPHNGMGAKDFLSLIKRITDWKEPMKNHVGPVYVSRQQAETILDARPFEVVDTAVVRRRNEPERRYVMLFEGHQKVLVLARGASGTYLALIKLDGDLRAQMQAFDSVYTTDDALDFLYQGDY